MQISFINKDQLEIAIDWIVLPWNSYVEWSPVWLYLEVGFLVVIKVKRGYKSCALIH